MARRAKGEKAGKIGQEREKSQVEMEMNGIETNSRLNKGPREIVSRISKPMYNSPAWPECQKQDKTVQNLPFLG